MYSNANTADTDIYMKQSFPSTQQLMYKDWNGAKCSDTSVLSSNYWECDDTKLEQCCSLTSNGYCNYGYSPCGGLYYRDSTYLANVADNETDVNANKGGYIYPGYGYYKA